MRLRIIALVVAISSLVLISFLVPLALVLRTLAADRAVSAATVRAQGLSPLVATLSGDSLRIAVAQVNAQDHEQAHRRVPARRPRARPARRRGRRTSGWPPPGAASLPGAGPVPQCSSPSRDWPVVRL